jgi:hypothetical protein
MSDELTITKKDAELIADIVIFKMKRVLHEQISMVIEEELSPLLEEMVQSISSNFKSLNEIQNFMSSINKKSSQAESSSNILREKETRNKRGFKKFLETGDPLGNQYAYAPNRYPRKSPNLSEETNSWDETNNWDNEDQHDVESMFSINDKILEEEENMRRKYEAQERFNRLNRTHTNEDQPKNTNHDSEAESGFIESFLNENAPAFAQRSQQRQRSSVDSPVTEREEDLMDEIIDDNVRQAMNELSTAHDDSMYNDSAFDSSAPYDEIFIPPDVKVSSESMPNISHAKRPTTDPIRGEELGFKDSGYEPIPPPEIV